MMTPDLDKLRAMDDAISAMEADLVALRSRRDEYLRSLLGSNANLTIKRRRLLGLCPDCGAEILDGRYYCEQCSCRRAKMAKARTTY